MGDPGKVSMCWGEEFCFGFVRRGRDLSVTLNTNCVATYLNHALLRLYCMYFLHLSYEFAG